MSMQQFSIPCDFSGKKIPCTFYIGQPEESHHPLFFQADWISKERGGVVPKEVMDSIQKLHEIALRNNVPLVELCKHALLSANYNADEAAPSVENQSVPKEQTATATDNNDSEEDARTLEKENSAAALEDSQSAPSTQELDQKEKEQIREEMLSAEADQNIQKKKKVASI